MVTIFLGIPNAATKVASKMPIRNTNVNEPALGERKRGSLDMLFGWDCPHHMVLYAWMLHPHESDALAQVSMADDHQSNDVTWVTALQNPFLNTYV